MPPTQAVRPLAVTTALGPDALVLTGFEGREQVSAPFRLSLRMASERFAIDPAAVLGKPACVRVELPSGGQRFVHGLVSRFGQADTRFGTDGRASYRAELVPWLWMLSLSADCRVFQHESVPDIVTGLFDELGFRDYRVALSRRYAPREFCVQYRETHLAFVSRLLEDEGIFYYFEHHADRHVLVLVEEPRVVRPCLPDEGLCLSPRYGDTRRDSSYGSLKVERVVHSAAVALSDYNFTTPSTSLEVALAGENGWGEVFDYPGGYERPSDGERYARLRLEAAEAVREVAEVTSAAGAVTSGHRLTLASTPRGAYDGEWLVLGVTHAAEQGGYIAGETDAGFRYENTFTAVRVDVPWRPPRVTPRPRVRGTQSALVVGLAGEEIYTDAQGRVKLHFYWDRRSRRDENSSCWVRCTFAWAGKQWGQFSVPRVGQEVLVDFLEGDPDRPVVVGRVYNADQPPPCDPGGSRGVVSGMRSKTHRGGGYNAMEMDDTAGKEKIAIHAQYDMTTAVGHDHTVTIGHDRTETVLNNETVSVVVNRSERVGVNEQGTIGANRTWQVGAADALTVGGSRTETVAVASTETVGAAKALSVGAAYQISVGGVLNVTVGGAMAEEIGLSRTIGVAKKFSLEAGDEIVLKTGDASITMKKNGDVVIKGKNITVKGSADVVVKGSKIAKN